MGGNENEVLQTNLVGSRFDSDAFGFVPNYAKLSLAGEVGV